MWIRSGNVQQLIIQMGGKALDSTRMVQQFVLHIITIVV